MHKKCLYVVDFCGSETAAEVKTLREAVNIIVDTAESCDEVLLRLESPGGTVNGYGLCASELDPKTRKSDVDKEVFFVSNSELSQRAIDSVRLSRNTYLTPSNFVQATAPVTTAPPATDEHGNIIPATPDEPEESTAYNTASTDATSATGEKPEPPTAPTEPPTTPEEKAPVGTGGPGNALICLGALFVATSALFVMRKKEILYN